VLSTKSHFYWAVGELQMQSGNTNGGGKNEQGAVAPCFVLL